MIAPGPPAVGLKKVFDQCCRSPTRRRIVTPRVINPGTMTRLVIETRESEFAAAIETSAERFSRLFVDSLLVPFERRLAVAIGRPEHNPRRKGAGLKNRSLLLALSPRLFPPVG